MSAKILPFITAEPTSAVDRKQTRTAGAALLEQLIAERGLTREEAARLIGRDARQLRKWLKKAPPVLELVAALQAGRRVA